MNLNKYIKLKFTNRTNKLALSTVFLNLVLRRHVESTVANINQKLDELS